MDDQAEGGSELGGRDRDERQMMLDRLEQPANNGLEHERDFRRLARLLVHPARLELSLLDPQVARENQDSRLARLAETSAKCWSLGEPSVR